MCCKKKFNVIIFKNTNNFNTYLIENIAFESKLKRNLSI